MKWETKNRINNINQLNQTRQKNKVLKNKPIEEVTNEKKIEEMSIYDGCGIIYTELLIKHLKEMKNECDSYIEESEGR